MPYVAAAAAAVAGVAGSAIQADAAGSAADKQAAASNNAARMSQANADRTREDLAVYRDSGSQALQALMAALGLGPGTNLLASNGVNGLAFHPAGGETFTPDQATLEATPGYKFTRDQGLQAVANSNAAKGLGVSGAAMKGAAQYATGLADNTLKTQQQIFQDNLNNQRTIFQGNLSNILGSLSGVATMGQNAAVQTGQSSTANINSANAASIGAANAQASGIVGGASAISSGFNSVASAPMNYQLYKRLLENNKSDKGSDSSGGVYQPAGYSTDPLTLLNNPGMSYGAG